MSTRSELEFEKERQLKDLILLAQDGDRESYRSLLRGLVPVITEFFLERTDASPKNLDELVQQTLIAVHLRLHTYCPECRLLQWIYAIASNQLPTSRERRSGSFVEAIGFGLRLALRFATRHAIHAEGN